MVQLQTSTSAKQKKRMNLVLDVENVRSVEPACATTQITLKDATASMTRPSVKGMQVSSAMVRQTMMFRDSCHCKLRIMDVITVMSPYDFVILGILP